MESEKYVNETELMKAKTKYKRRTEITTKYKILPQKSLKNK